MFLRSYRSEGETRGILFKWTRRRMFRKENNGNGVDSFLRDMGGRVYDGSCVQ